MAREVNTELGRLWPRQYFSQTHAHLSDPSLRAIEFQPVPAMATYAATKLSETLSHELAGDSMHVIGGCPGPTTRFFDGQQVSEQTRCSSAR